jgi:cytochrome c peroxidase
VFRVASLRNVAMTPPYFNDGSVTTPLPEAVKVMARVQLGVALGETDVREIVAFLESLTGELPADFATKHWRAGDPGSERGAGRLAVGRTDMRKGMN